MGFWDLIVEAIPVEIRIAIIVLNVGILLPAIIVSIVIWFMTGSFFDAGITFLIVAGTSLFAK